MYNLKTYLRNVYELEASVYQQTQISQFIEDKLRSLPKQSPSKPNFSYYGIIMMAIGAVGIYVGTRLWTAYFIGSSLLTFAVSGLLLFLGFLLSSEESSKRNAYKQSLSRYEKSLTIRKALESDLPALRNKLSETQTLLRSYYAKGVLHPKYQNFVAVAYLLDCIDTGRYTKLDGPDGAYNQFELEVRMDRISSQLDTVIDKLDQIRQNQYSLYAAITQANRTNALMMQKLDGYCRNLENLNSSADQIRRSLDTANHTAELTRKEIAYRNYLDRGSSYSY